jgi:hypothetical protein
MAATIGVTGMRVGKGKGQEKEEKNGKESGDMTGRGGVSAMTETMTAGGEHGAKNGTTYRERPGGAAEVEVEVPSGRRVEVRAGVERGDVETRGPTTRPATRRSARQGTKKAPSSIQQSPHGGPGRGQGPCQDRDLQPGIAAKETDPGPETEMRMKTMITNHGAETETETETSLTAGA